jgi:class 3 adenylate cyclase
LLRVAGLPTGTITFLLTDVPGSAERWEAAPDATAAALARLDGLVEDAAARCGGHLVKPRGENDSHFLVFAAPADAAAAALRLGAAVASDEHIPLRMAMSTGPADLRDGDYFGPVVNHCARLRAAAHARQVVVGESTALLIAPELRAPARADAPLADASLVDLGWHWLKDLTHPLRAFELRHPDLPSGFAPLASLAPPAADLPLPLTSFVARRSELAWLRDALGTGAPVTVTGPPGVGKSRLAIELAAAIGRAGQSLVRVIDVDAGAPLVIGPAPMPTLVIFDNADHRRDDVVAAIAASAASDVLSVVTTARSPLGITGEAVHRLAPLAPDDAAALLVDRARAARSSVDLDPGNATTIAISEALDGLPLAIELAATRLAVLSPEQLLARLEDPSRVLATRSATTPPHHRSFADAVAWSLPAADSDERRSLDALTRGESVDADAAARLVASGWAEPAGDGARVLDLVLTYVRGSAS